MILFTKDGFGHPFLLGLSSFHFFIGSSSRFPLYLQPPERLPVPLQSGSLWVLYGY
jgi:hypothetical protein